MSVDGPRTPDGRPVPSLRVAFLRYTGLRIAVFVVVFLALGLTGAVPFLAALLVGALVSAGVAYFLLGRLREDLARALVTRREEKDAHLRQRRAKLDGA